MANRIACSGCGKHEIHTLPVAYSRYHHLGYRPDVADCVNTHVYYTDEWPNVLQSIRDAISQRNLDGMMMQLELTKETVDVGNDVELDHIYCNQCYPDPDAHCIAFCGTDVTTMAAGWSGDDSNECVVCIELKNCPICGE
jgi:hypothetical protein